MDILEVSILKLYKGSILKFIFADTESSRNVPLSNEYKKNVWKFLQMYKYVDKK